MHVCDGRSYAVIGIFFRSFASPKFDRSEESDLNSDRKFSNELRRHYGWSGHWDSLFGAGGIATPIAADVTGAVPVVDPGASNGNSDSHLRSANQTIGYEIEAVDGHIGHVQDFVIEDTNWKISALVVNTGNWWPGKQVSIDSAKIKQVN